MVPGDQGAGEAGEGPEGGGGSSIDFLDAAEEALNQFIQVDPDEPEFGVRPAGQVCGPRDGVLGQRGTVDRNEFGISWNAPLPGGGFLLPDTVRLSASFSAVKAV